MRKSRAYTRKVGVSNQRPLFLGGPDPITLNKMESILRQARDVSNSRMTTNASWPIAGAPTSMQRGYYEIAELDPRRNYARDCGWPITVSPQDYKELIDREPIAGLVNEIYPIESWAQEPYIYEDDDEENMTGFEESYADLHQMIGREPSYFDGDRSSIVNQILLNLDQLCGIGRYGALLIGLDDGKDLEEPVVPRKGMKVTFLRPFPEHMARIVMFDMDWTSPRYGLPIRYLVTFADPQDMSSTGVNENFMARQVHWSRILHVPDLWHHPSSSPIFAIERLRPVLNPILDIRKIRGSSAEGFYQAAFQALHFGSHPQLGPDVEMDRDSILDMYEQFANGLQRVLVSTGATVDMLAPTIPEVTQHMLIQIQAICTKMRVPMRIMMGSERGELASGDDKVKWNSMLVSRQNAFNTPRIIIPFIDRLINYGVLQKPKKGYKVFWPDLMAVSATERADVLLKRTQAYGFYATQNVESIIPPLEYYTKFDNISYDEAELILEASQSNQNGGMMTQQPIPMEPVTTPGSPPSSTSSKVPSSKSATASTRSATNKTTPVTNKETLDKEIADTEGKTSVLGKVAGTTPLAEPPSGPLGSSSTYDTPSTSSESPNFADDGNNPRVASQPVQNKSTKKRMPVHIKLSKKRRKEETANEAFDTVLGGRKDSVDTDIFNTSEEYVKKILNEGADDGIKNNKPPTSNAFCPMGEGGTVQDDCVGNPEKGAQASALSREARAQHSTKVQGESLLGGKDKKAHTKVKDSKKPNPNEDRQEKVQISTNSED